MKRFSTSPMTVGALLLAAMLAVGDAQAQQPPPADYFKQNCMSCHTVGGGRLTGPDLKDVAQRKNRAWLVQFLQNPKAMIDSGDPYASQLQREARGVVMPTVAGMDAVRATAMLEMIDSESKLPRSQFAGMQISDRPFTPQDITAGRELFLGTRRAAAGGPPCLSCHTVRSLPALGGGRLGPDLTQVYGRLQGRKGMAAWLANPASVTMTPVYRARALQPEEILPLIAFFEAEARNGGQDDTTAMLNFFLLGLGGMVLGLFSLDAIFKKRLRGVRRRLVHGNRGEE